MKIGYACIYKDDTSLHLQYEELKKAGCKKIFEDKVSDKDLDRPGLHAAVNYAKKKDTIIVWRLDRFSDSEGGFIEVANHLLSKGMGFSSLQWDTSC